MKLCVYLVLFTLGGKKIFNLLLFFWGGGGGEGRLAAKVTVRAYQYWVNRRERKNE